MNWRMDGRGPVEDGSSTPASVWALVAFALWLAGLLTAIVAAILLGMP